MNQIETRVWNFAPSAIKTDDNPANASVEGSGAAVISEKGGRCGNNNRRRTPKQYKFHLNLILAHRKKATLDSLIVRDSMMSAPRFISESKLTYPMEKVVSSNNTVLAGDADR